jgi:Family of unknown function (DUF5677)
VASNDQYLMKLYPLVDEIRRKIESSTYCSASQPQERVLLDFLDRARQIAHACFLSASEGLGTPLYVLLRVICEDLFISLWVANDAENARAYEAQVLSDATRMMAVNLDKGFAALKTISTGEDKTAALLPEIKQRFKQPRTRIEQIAKEVGLEKIYDFIYRIACLEVHGKSFIGDRPMVDEKGLQAALPAITSFVKAVMLITDNCVVSHRKTEVRELFDIFKI